MDNNNDNSFENQSSEQPQPIYETIPSDTMQPEEVGSEVSNPDDVLSAIPTDLPPDQNYYQDLGGGGGGLGGGRNRLFIIAAGVVFFIIIFLIIVFFVLPGKGTNTPAGPSQEVTLTYWGLWEDKDVYDGLIADFEKKNPKIKIKYEKKSQLDYREKLIARSQNKVGPDIFRFHNTWLPEIKDVVAPLPESIMTKAEFEKTFYPVHARDLKVGEYYYGIPLTIDGMVLLYNEDILKAAGYDKPPPLWDPFLKMLDDVTVIETNGTIKTSGLAIGTASNIEHFSDLYGLIYLQNLGLSNPNSAKFTNAQVWLLLKQINSQAGQKIFRGYRSLAEEGIGYWNEKMPNSLQAFMAGKVATIYAPSWEILTIKSINPDFPVKAAPVPQLPQDVNPNYIALASYWVEGVSKYSDKQVYAWQFLKFLSEKENMVKLYEAQRKKRLFGEPYSRVDLADKLINDPYVGAVLKQAKYYYSLPVITRTFDGGGVQKDAKGGLNDNIVKYLENAINGSIDGQSDDSVLNQARQGVEQVFSTYEIKE